MASIYPDIETYSRFILIRRFTAIQQCWQSARCKEALNQLRIFDGFLWEGATIPLYYLLFLHIPFQEYSRFLPVEIRKQIKDELEKSSIPPYLYFHRWFALELYTLNQTILKHGSSYLSAEVIDQISYVNDWLKHHTWLKQLSIKNTQKLKEFDLSALKKLRYPPKPFQIEALKKFLKIKLYTPFRGMILAFDQGLGKTYTSIMIATALRKTLNVIVSPNSLKLNWKDEILKFRVDVTDANIFVVGEDSARKLMKNADKIQWVIVNYESLHKLFPIVERIRRYRRVVLIVDESQNIRNVDTKRVKHLAELIQKYNVNDVLLLSGTPIKGLLSEFASYFLLIDPIFDQYALKIFRIVYGLKKGDPIFKRRLDLYMIRFTKEQVLANELPEKKEITDECVVNDNDAKREYLTISAIRELFKQKLKQYSVELFKVWCELRHELLAEVNRWLSLSASEIRNPSALSELKRLAQLIKQTYETCIPEPVKQCKQFEFVSSKACSLRLTEIRALARKLLLEQNVLGWTKVKADQFVRDIVFLLQPQYRIVAKAITDSLNTALYNLVLAPLKFCPEKVCGWISRSTKTLIFTKSAKAVNELKQLIVQNCKLSDNQVYIVTGEIEDKHGTVKQFKSDPNSKVLIATYATLGAGFTITEADTVLYWDLPWREADLRQAQDRVYRIGQDKPVKMVYIKLVTKEPNIQDAIDELLAFFREYQGDILRPSEYEAREAEAKQSLAKRIFGDLNPIEMLRRAVSR